ncbi:hypothetical protein TNCV_559941 [Trichonephila clavipes]|nr:hypothetical protein TNCV_559941 [Trichonephila clavipes]
MMTIRNKSYISDYTCAGTALFKLPYYVRDPWREQLDRDGPTDSRLGLIQMSLLAREDGKPHPGAFFEPRTYTSSCEGTLAFILLEDAIILEENKNAQ